ncbi:MAG: FAD-binding protein, partial [Candidatus Margulisiibacteriota bacterium]
MNYREISFKLPTEYSPEQIRQIIKDQLHLKDFTFQILNKSLDARKKDDIHWLIRFGISSPELKEAAPVKEPTLVVPHRERDEQVVVVGSGPAGFFAGLVLQEAGFKVTIIERGSEVKKRAEDIVSFEAGGAFSTTNNYAFGEGGAGTFSDGKLTSRTKHITQERQYILDSYVSAGAPQEIEYLAHPHLGTDNLRKIVHNLRSQYLELGGKILFDTKLEDLVSKNGKVTAVVTSAGNIEADHFIIAPGNSAFDTYRMLMKSGVKFRNKGFALGCRVEHPQELINDAQWGKKSLPGLKAAEYRLTSPGDGVIPIYTFCMCPGGTVVPSMSVAETNVVNGMSRYQRDGKFANAGCVAGVKLDDMLGRTVEPQEALDLLEKLEARFYKIAKSYRVPFCSVQDFITRKMPATTPASSYP